MGGDLKNITPEEKAIDLVNQFKNILMDEDTECGNEILCTSIAIKNALIVVNEVMFRVPYADNNKAKWITDEETIRYWQEVKEELNKL